MKKKTHSSLYLVSVPARLGQSGGVKLIAGRRAADAYKAKFVDAYVSHIPYMRTAEAVAKSINPILRQPVPPRAAPPAAALKKPEPVSTLWVARDPDDGEERLFETEQDAKEFIAFMRTECGFRYALEVLT